jgi:hypothetical protein
METMTDLSTSAVALVQDMKAAVLAAGDRLRENYLKITKVELELRTVVQKSAGGGVSIRVLEIDGDISRDETGTLSVTLVPAKGGLQLMAPPSEELIAAIVATAAASAEASQLPPRFDLTESTVTLDVGVTMSGKVQLFAHGAGSREKGHTMTITLEPL